MPVPPVRMIWDMKYGLKLHEKIAMTTPNVFTGAARGR